MTGSASGPGTPGTRAALDELARLVLADENLQTVLERVVNLAQRLRPAGAKTSLTVLREQRPARCATWPRTSCSPAN